MSEERIPERDDDSGKESVEETRSSDLEQEDAASAFPAEHPGADESVDSDLDGADVPARQEEDSPVPSDGALTDSDSAVSEVKAESGVSDQGPAEEANAPADEQEPVHEMTFTEHLNELRVRLVRCIIAAFVGMLLCYGFAEQLFMLLMAPLLNLLEPMGGSLIYTGLAEAFFTHMKVAAIAGLFLVSPYIFYQIWMFIAPGLYEGERKYMIPIALASAVCFVTGALFGYLVVFPYGFQFFLGYASEFIKPMPSVKEYFSFSTGLLFAFGLIFEMPLFMLFLSALGIVTYKTLRKYRKYAILGNFIVAAILTPPDVVSQCLMAGPMCLLYEIGIWVSYLFGKKPKEPVADEAEAAAADSN